MATNTGPFDLARTPLHLGSIAADASHVVALTDFHFDGPSFGRYVTEHCSAAEPGRIIMIESSPEDWGQWECHTLGDEIVIVLAGAGTFLQERDGHIHSMPFEAGDTIINPRGVWHTADVSEPMRAIYLTPALGTEHRAR